MARHWRSYGRSDFWGGGFWRPYVSVSERRDKAARKIASLRKKGREVEPVEIEGRAIARTFWGKSWCENLERYSDFENRLPRGRTYVRNGSVIDLKITPGRVAALVSGSEIYETSIEFSPLERRRWKSIVSACAGKIDSVVELLQGKLSQGVMQVLTAGETGLFPAPREIKMSCSCPDWAEMCKHVAAVLYGVGARLDARPDLLFVLREVDQAELVSAAAAGAALVGSGAPAGALDSSALEKLFGIEIEKEAGASPVQRGKTQEGARRRRASRAAGEPAPSPATPEPKASETASEPRVSPAPDGTRASRAAGRPVGSPGAGQVRAPSSAPEPMVSSAAPGTILRRARRRGPRLLAETPSAPPMPAAEPVPAPEPMVRGGRGPSNRPEPAVGPGDLAPRIRRARGRVRRAQAPEPAFEDLGPLAPRIPILRRHFAEEDRLTNSDYRRLFSVPVAIASRELARLTDRMLLIRRGQKRGAHYLAGVELGAE